MILQPTLPVLAQTASSSAVVAPEVAPAESTIDLPPLVIDSDSSQDTSSKKEKKDKSNNGNASSNNQPATPVAPATPVVVPPPADTSTGTPNTPVVEDSATVPAEQSTGTPATPSVDITPPPAPDNSGVTTPAIPTDTSSPSSGGSSNNAGNVGATPSPATNSGTVSTPSVEQSVVITPDTSTSTVSTTDPVVTPPSGGSSNVAPPSETSTGTPSLPVVTPSPGVDTSTGTPAQPVPQPEIVVGTTGPVVQIPQDGQFHPMIKNTQIAIDPNTGNVRYRAYATESVGQKVRRSAQSRKQNRQKHKVTSILAADVSQGRKQSVDGTEPTLRGKKVLDSSNKTKLKNDESFAYFFSMPLDDNNDVLVRPGKMEIGDRKEVSPSKKTKFQRTETDTQVETTVKNIYPHVDFVFYDEDTHRSKDIVLNRKPQQLREGENVTFWETYVLPEGAIVWTGDHEPVEDGATMIDEWVYIQLPSGSTMVITPSYVYDSVEGSDMVAVSQTVQFSNNGQQLQIGLEVPASYLLDKNRQYPVTVDPAYFNYCYDNNSIGGECSLTAYTIQAANGTSPSSGHIVVGNTLYVGRYNHETRHPVLYFDVDFTQTIEVLQADLVLNKITSHNIGTDTSFTMEAKRIESTRETANEWPPENNADIQNTNYAYFRTHLSNENDSMNVLDGDTGLTRLDLTDTVNEWRTGEPNLGVVVEGAADWSSGTTPPSSWENRYHRFDSESGTISPYIDIDLANNTAPELAGAGVHTIEQGAQGYNFTFTSGQTFTMGATLHNFGGGNAGNFTAKLYWSSDASFDANSDSEIATVDTTGITSFSTQGITFSDVIVPTVVDGTYHLFLITDSEDDISEVNEYNNDTSIEVTVQSSGGSGNNNNPPPPPPPGNAMLDMTITDFHIVNPEAVYYGTDEISYKITIDNPNSFAQTGMGIAFTVEDILSGNRMTIQSRYTGYPVPANTEIEYSETFHARSCKSNMFGCNRSLRLRAEIDPYPQSPYTDDVVNNVAYASDTFTLDYNNPSPARLAVAPGTFVPPTNATQGTYLSVPVILSNPGDTALTSLPVEMLLRDTQTGVTYPFTTLGFYTTSISADTMNQAQTITGNVPSGLPFGTRDYQLEVTINPTGAGEAGNGAADNTAEFTQPLQVTRTPLAPLQTNTPEAESTGDVTVTDQVLVEDRNHKNSDATAGDPVNTRTGGFEFVQTDFSLSGIGPDLDFARSYNSRTADSEGRLGYGWNHTYHTYYYFNATADTLTIMIGGLEYALFSTSDGGATFSPMSGERGTVIRTNTTTFEYRTLDGLVYTFAENVSDSTGFLSSITDPNGNALSLSYTATTDPGDNTVTIPLLSTITDAAGRTLSLSYGSGSEWSKIISATLAGDANTAAKSVNYTYDTNLDLQTVASDRAYSGTTETVSKSFGYDSNHHMISYTDPRGTIVRTSYNTEGRAINQYEHNPRIDAPGTDRHVFAYRHTTSTSEMPTGAAQCTAVDHYRDASNYYTITDCYDYANLLHSRQVGNRLSTTFAYNNQGLKTSETNPTGDTTSYTYDSSRRVDTITAPATADWQLSTDYDYENTFNRITQVTETATPVSGGSTVVRTTNTTVDPTSGNILTVTDPRGNVDTYVYDATGNVANHTDKRGNTASYTYDARGYRIGTSQAVTAHDNTQTTVTTAATFDLHGHQLTNTDANGNVSSYAYDNYGNVRLLTNPDSSTRQYTYDLEDHLVSQTDERGTVKNYVYDTDIEASLLSETIVNPSGSDIVTSYGYDWVGNRVSETDPRNFVTTINYNASNEITSKVGPLLTENFGYDGAGRVTSRTTNAGERTDTFYDALGQVTETRSYTDSTNYITELQSYDAWGNVVSRTDGRGNAETFAYDLGDNLTSHTDRLSNITSYTYDAAGNRVSELRPRAQSDATLRNASGHSTSYTYDELGRAVRDVNALDQHTLTRYDAAGKISQTIDRQNSNGTENSHVTNYTYDNRGRLATETDALGGVTTYIYDAAGNVTNVNDTRGNNTASTYDFAGRQATKTDATNNTWTYVYDAAGNQTGVTQPNAGTQSYTYDANGNRTGETNAIGASKSYGYDAAGRLTSETDERGTITTYSYDALGRRLSTTNDLIGQNLVTTYAYDDNGNRTEMNAGGIVSTWSYDREDRVTVEETAGKLGTYWAYDAEGNMLIETTSNRFQTVYSRDALGRVTKEVSDSEGIVDQQVCEGTILCYTFSNGNTEDLGSLGVNLNVYGGAIPTTDRHGRIGSAYNFDGTGYLRGTGLDLTNLGDFTISYWYRQTSVPSWYNYRFAIHSGSLGHGSGGDQAIGVSDNIHQPTSARVAYQYLPSNGTGNDLDPMMIDAPTLNDWHQEILVRDGNTFRIYRDGVLFRELNVSRPDFNLIDGLINIGGPNFFGGNDGWTDNGRASAKWVGDIDDFRVYNRALTNTEIVNGYVGEGQLSTDDSTTADTRCDNASLCYTMENATVSGDIVDDGSLGVNLSINGGATATADRHGVADQAMHFDGTGYLEATGVNLGSLNDFTVAYWYRQTANPSWYKHRFAIHSGATGQGANGDQVIGVEDNYHMPTSDRVTYLFTTGNSQSTVLSGARIDAPNLDGWHLEVLVREGNTFRIYRDGTQIREVIANNNAFTITSGMIHLGAPNYYGSGNGWTANGRATAKWVGDLDDFRLYRNALSASDIATMYQSEVAPLTSTSTPLLPTQSAPSDCANTEVCYTFSQGDYSDHSAFGLDLTAHGNVATTDDRHGRADEAVFFDGNSYLEASNVNIANLDDFTLSYWYTQTADPSWYNYRFAIHSGLTGYTNTGNQLIGVQDNAHAPASNRVMYHFTTSNGEANALGGNTISVPSQNTWTKETLVREGNTFRIYRDGNLIDQTTYNKPVFNLSNGYIHLGAPNYYGGGNGWTDNGRATAKWVGAIDDFRLARNASSNADILAAYQADMQVPTSPSTTVASGPPGPDAPISVTTTYSYNNWGNIATSQRETLGNVDSSATYTYDALGRQTSEARAVAGTTLTTSHTFDAAGNILTTTDPAGRVEAHTYDAAGRQLTTSVDGTTVKTNVYDSLGNVTSVTLGNGTTEAYTFDLSGRELSQTVANTGGNLSTRSYAYDNAGNRTSDTIDSVTTNYTYDSLGQLLTVANPSLSQTYTYDTRGNRLSLTDNGVLTTYVYATNTNQLESYTSNSVTTDLVYDAAGNLLTDGTNTYTWLPTGELYAHSTASGDTIYQYDEFGNRLAKTVGTSTTYTVNAGLNVALEVDTNGTVQKTIIGGVGELDAAGTLTYIHRDVLGSAVVVTDNTGAQVEAYLYDAFGAMNGSSAVTDYTYTNQEYDAESSLMYYNARYYDPALGRFISRDSYLGHDRDVLTRNRYIYVLNNPLKYVDPTGNQPENYEFTNNGGEIYESGYFSDDGLSYFPNTQNSTVNHSFDTEFYDSTDVVYQTILETAPGTGDVIDVYTIVTGESIDGQKVGAGERLFYVFLGVTPLNGGHSDLARGVGKKVLVRVTRSNAGRILAKNVERATGVVKPKHWAAHHIVPIFEERFESAKNARKILERFNVDPNDAANGIYLPHRKADRLDDVAFHPDLNNKNYSDAVYEELRYAQSRNDVIDALGEIRSGLQTNSFEF